MTEEQLEAVARLQAGLNHHDHFGAAPDESPIYISCSRDDTLYELPYADGQFNLGDLRRVLEVVALTVTTKADRADIGKRAEAIVDAWFGLGDVFRARSILKGLIENEWEAFAKHREDAERPLLERIEALEAEKAKLMYAVEAVEGDLLMLKMAIEASDPRSELLIRATDAERLIRQALGETQ